MRERFDYKDLPNKIEFECKGKKYRITDEDLIWDMLKQCMSEDCYFYGEVEEVG